MSAAKGNANEMPSLKFANEVKSFDSFSSMHFQYPTTSRACGMLPEHTVGCECQCCCAARTANEPCTCPPEMQMSETDSETSKANTPPPTPPPKKPKEKLWMPLVRTLAKEYNVKNAPPPLDVGPRLGGSGYRWQGELIGHIPNCPCERCQLLHGDPYNHTILNSGRIYKFDAAYFGKIAHIPNCPCPPCRVKRGLSRLPPPKLPKFKYKPEPPMEQPASPTAPRIDPTAKEEPPEPNYDTHPLNCTCMECCRALGNDKPFGHPEECKCGLCRRAAGLFKPPGHSDFCTCEFCCAAVGKLKPAGHMPECQCPECLNATEPEPQFDDFINEMPVLSSADTNSMIVVFIALAVLLIVIISWYVYWVGTL